MTAHTADRLVKYVRVDLTLEKGQPVCVPILYKVTVSAPSDAALPLDLRMFSIRMCVLCLKCAQSKPDREYLRTKNFPSLYLKC